MEELKGVRTPILNEGSPEELREKVRSYFHQTFSIDEKLYDSIASDAGFYLRADPLRHPLVFYFGHTAVFYINKLNIAHIVNKRINPEYESMFAVGVDEMSWDDLNSAHYNWPTIPEVKAYRDKVRLFVDELISTLPLGEDGIHWDSPWWAIMMGIEHQRIHLETSSVLIRQLPLDQVRQLDFWNFCPESGKAPKNMLLEVSGAEVVIGKKRCEPLYGWDCEYGSKSYVVKDFKASRYLVSNAEFMEFVQDGGYNSPDYWTEEGWKWKTYQQCAQPRFWQKNEAGEWMLRTMASIIPLPWNHPVEVNYLEAKAFCNWLSAKTGKPIRLPSEEQWYRMHDMFVKTDQPYWEKAPGNLNLEYYASACPVDEFCFGAFYDIIGNVWQWTETPISALPGFQIHPYYDDFSVPTFDTRHNLMKGGSFISTGNEALRSARYAFRRHFYQHAGFRYVESAEPVIIEDDLYEADPDMISWCELNWGENPWGGNFHAELVAKLQPYLESVAKNKALSFGCKTGRSAFELARYFAQVSGLEATARFIRLATNLKERGYLRHYSMLEGEIWTTVERDLAQFGLADFASNCEFGQADSANLLAKYTGYDFALVENVLEQSSNPKAYLQEVHLRLNPGAILVIADGYDWNEKYTPAENRLGGYRKDGEPYTNFEGVRAILQEHFELAEPPFEMLQGIKQGGRLWQTKQLQVSIWKLK